MVLALAFTESSFRYDVKHPDNYTLGIGGLKPFHKTLNDINSLLAVEEVWVKYLTITKGDKRKALKLYKGTKKNLKSFNKTWAIYTKLKEIP